MSTRKTIHLCCDRAHSVYSSSYDIAWATIVANHHDWDDETLQSWQELFEGEDTLSKKPLPKGRVAYEDESIEANTLETQEMPTKATESVSAGLDYPTTESPTTAATHLDSSEQPLRETSPARDDLFEESFESPSRVIEESDIVTSKTFVLGILIAITVPCIICVVIIVILVKGFHYSTRVLARRTRLFDIAVGLLLLLAMVSQLSQRRLRTSEIDRERDDLTIDFMLSKFNRSLLWITTPSLTIPLKPLMVLEKGFREDRDWVISAFMSIQNYSRKLASGFSTLSPWAKMNELPLEQGKSRVRWRCVSVP